MLFIRTLLATIKEICILIWLYRNTIDFGLVKFNPGCERFFRQKHMSYKTVVPVFTVMLISIWQRAVAKLKTMIKNNYKRIGDISWFMNTASVMYTFTQRCVPLCIELEKLIEKL